jgi:hypothetical protein
LIGLRPFTTFNQKYNVSNAQLNTIRPINWGQHHYIELPPFSKTEITRIFGYFQSYKYFDEYKDKLFRMIRLSQLQEDVCSEYSNYFNTSSLPIVSMHFRYGDYKNLQKYHNLLPYEYYLDSLKYMLSIYNRGVRVLYFCEKEDNNIILEVIHQLQNEYMNANVEFIKVDDMIIDWKQLILMSCCDSHIIANSTYSWWGAYFNTKPNKQVCYPSKWFGPVNEKKNIVDDMFLDSWKKIKVE